MSSRRRQIAQQRRDKGQGTGSPPIGEPAFLLVGRLQRPHGVRGEMLMAVMTDFPERLKPGVVLYMGNRYQPVEITRFRHHNKGTLVTLEGYHSRQDVEHLRNQDLFVKVEDRPPLEEGEYYLHELIGMGVVTDQGEALGRVAEMIETGANDVFVVRPEEGQDVLLPFTDEVILAIDVPNKQMTVHLLEGLLPEG